MAENGLNFSKAFKKIRNPTNIAMVLLSMVAAGCGNISIEVLPCLRNNSQSQVYKLESNQPYEVPVIEKKQMQYPEKPGLELVTINY